MQFRTGSLLPLKIKLYVRVWTSVPLAERLSVCSVNHDGLLTEAAVCEKGKNMSKDNLL